MGGETTDLSALLSEEALHCLTVAIGKKPTESVLQL